MPLLYLANIAAIQILYLICPSGGGGFYIQCYSFSCQVYALFKTYFYVLLFGKEVQDQIKLNVEVIFFQMF